MQAFFQELQINSFPFQTPDYNFGFCEWPFSPIVGTNHSKLVYSKGQKSLLCFAFDDSFY